jgi:RNA polymerase sigma-70 factor (ECF subfamily)
VEGWCRQAGPPAEDAADVRQEVFRTVAQSIATFRRDRPGDSFRGWLYATTRSRVADFRRRADRQPRAAGGSDAHERLMELPAEEPPGSAVANADAGAVSERCVRLIRVAGPEATLRRVR